MRKNYIDNLRSILILMLIPYHAAMAWNIWNEPNYILFEGNKILSSFIVFLSPYFMPVMFVIAGISTYYALQKRTAKQYICERSKKLMLPFLFGTLLLMPPMTYIADKFNYNYSGNFFQHYGIFFTKFTDLTGADGGFSVGQLWFILYLFLISLAGAGIIELQKRIKPEYKKSVSIPVICILGIPLVLLSEILSVGGKSLAEYLYLFLIGYYIFSNENSANKISKYKWIFLSIGLTAAAADVYLFIWSNTKYPLINSAVKYIAEWFMIIALLGIGKSFLNFRTKLTAYLSKTSFSFYIFHYIWVVLFQYLLFNTLKGNTILLYIVPVILSFPATFICCHIYLKIRSA